MEECNLFLLLLDRIEYYWPVYNPIPQRQMVILSIPNCGYLSMSSSTGAEPETRIRGQVV